MNKSKTKPVEIKSIVCSFYLLNYNTHGLKYAIYNNRSTSNNQSPITTKRYYS